MKKKKHPEYHQFIFEDSSTGKRFVCGAAMKPKETSTFEGKEYPLYRVPISSSSHPFFVGNQQFVDREGRIEQFNKRYASKTKKQSAQSE